MAVKVRVGVNNVVEHARANLISTNEGHLVVSVDTRSRDNTIAIYAPGSWANAVVTADSE